METPELKVYQNGNKFIVKKPSKKKMGKEKKYFDSDTAIRECEKGNPAFLITLFGSEQGENFYNTNKEQINNTISDCLSGENSAIENFLLIIDSDIDMSIKNEILEYLFFKNPTFLGKIFGIDKPASEINFQDIFTSAGVSIENNEIKINEKIIENKCDSITLSFLQSIHINRPLQDFIEGTKDTKSRNTKTNGTMFESVSMLFIDIIKEKCDNYLGNEKNIEIIENNLSNKEKEYKQEKPGLKQERNQLKMQNENNKGKIKKLKNQLHIDKYQIFDLKKKTKENKNLIKEINNKIRSTKIFISLKKVFVKKAKDEKATECIKEVKTYKHQQLFEKNKNLILWICTKQGFTEISKNITEKINMCSESKNLYQDAISTFIKKGMKIIKNKHQHSDGIELQNEINCVLSNINNGLKINELKREAAKQFTEYYIKKKDTKNLTIFISGLQDNISRKTAIKVAIHNISEKKENKNMIMIDFIENLDLKSKEFAINTAINDIIKNNSDMTTEKLSEFINNFSTDSQKIAINCINNKIEKYENEIESLSQVKDNLEKSKNEINKQTDKTPQKIENKKYKLDILKSFQNIGSSNYKHIVAQNNGTKIINGNSLV